MKQLRLLEKEVPVSDPDVRTPPPTSGVQLREQLGLLHPEPQTEAERVDAVIAAGRAASWSRKEKPADEPSREQKRSRRKRVVRAHTVSVKRMTKRELELGRLLYPVDDEAEQKPKTRAECADVQRPCPFVSCRHHLYLDVSARTGAIKLNFPDLEVHELAESCALDVADRNGVTLEGVGEIMNLTRERIRQVEVKGLAKLKAAREAGALKEYWGDEGPVGKRRLPVLQPDSDDDASDFDAEEFASAALDAE